MFRNLSKCENSIGLYENNIDLYENNIDFERPQKQSPGNSYSIQKFIWKISQSLQENIFYSIIFWLGLKLYWKKDRDKSPKGGM